jgi:RNA polymerase sigma factor (sigma-70 family)
MASDTPVRSVPAQAGEHPAARASLYARSGAERWGVTPKRFAEALERSAARRFPTGTRDPAQLERYWNSLHLEDLALACGCADGDEAAWSEFVSGHSERLYAAAHAIVHPASDTAARELADSLYAELYGIGRGNSLQPSARRPLFDYFHGRSKLETWLRAVLAQRYVDRLRESSRYLSLDGDPAAAARLRGAQTSADPERAAAVVRLHEALAASVGELAARDRLAVNLYYLRGKKLAEIARILGEHEATVSRRLERVRQNLRQEVEQRLEQQGLSPAQIELCYACALDEGPFDLARSLGAPAKHGLGHGEHESHLPPGAPKLQVDT